MLSLVAFDNIDQSASAESIRAWTAQEERAIKECAQNINVMDIYDITMEKCEFNIIILPWSCDTFSFPLTHF